MGWAVEDGTHGQLMLGMDAARQGYYQSYGGRPGLSYLLREFSGLLEARGVPAAARESTFCGARRPGRRAGFDVRRRTGAGFRVPLRGGPGVTREPLLTSVVGSAAHPGW